MIPRRVLALPGLGKDLGPPGTTTSSAGWATTAGTWGWSSPWGSAATAATRTHGNGTVGRQYLVLSIWTTLCKLYTILLKLWLVTLTTNIFSPSECTTRSSRCRITDNPADGRWDCKVPRMCSKSETVDVRNGVTWRNTDYPYGTVCILYCGNRNGGDRFKVRSWSTN